MPRTRNDESVSVEEISNWVSDSSVNYQEIYDAMCQLDPQFLLEAISVRALEAASVRLTASTERVMVQLALSAQQEEKDDYELLSVADENEEDGGYQLPVVTTPVDRNGRSLRDTALHMISTATSPVVSVLKEVAGVMNAVTGNEEGFSSFRLNS